MMPSTPLPSARRATCRLVVWYLLIALPVYGLSATLVQLLGASHVHVRTVQAAASLDGWHDFRRAVARTERHAAVHLHAHAAFARHRHARDDVSVVALDARAGDHGAAAADASSSDGSATLVFALAGTAEPCQPYSRLVGWPRAEPVTPAGREVMPAERPPRV